MVCMLLVYILGLTGIYNINCNHMHALISSLIVNSNKFTSIIIIIITTTTIRYGCLLSHAFSSWYFC